MPPSSSSPLAQGARAERLGLLACFACLLLPWVSPFAGGPSSWVHPWLLGATGGALCFLALALLSSPVAAPHPAIGWGLAAIAAWAALRSGVSPELLALAAAGLLIYLAAAIAASARRLPRLLDLIALAWLLAAALNTAVALIQYFGLAEAFAPWVSAAGAGEALANLRQRNQFASLCLIGMASIFWLTPRRLKPWHAAFALGWLAVGAAATTSRTGLAQILMLGVLACLWPGPRRQRAVLWLVALLAYALAAFCLPKVLESVSGTVGNALWERVAAVDACSSRTVLWSNVLHLIAQHPWLGWGWGELDYAHYITLYPGLRFCDILDNAHSMPLHLAVELGVPAALLICAALLWALLRAAPWREGDPARQMAWAALAVMGVHSLLEYPLWYAPFQIACGLCLGLLWPAVTFTAGAGAGAGAGADASRASTSRRPIALWLALGLVAACAYAAWDYRRVSQIYLPVEARAAGFQHDPLAAIRGSWLFRNQARFAELTTTALTRANAPWTRQSALDLLHYSPEPRVIEKLIESGTLLGRDQEVLVHLARFRAAFPDAHASWSQQRAGAASAASAGQ